MIRNEFVVTKDMYIDWCRETLKKGATGKFQIFWAALAVIMFVMGIALFISDLPERKFGLYFFALGAFCVFRCFRYKGLYNSYYKRLSKMMGQENWVRIVDFADDEIITSGGNVTIKNNYSDITGIRIYGSKVCIDMNNSSVVRIYKDSFTQGSYEELLKIIKDKNKLIKIIDN